jgi:hypothetical protein
VTNKSRGKPAPVQDVSTNRGEWPCYFANIEHRVGGLAEHCAAEVETDISALPIRRTRTRTTITFALEGASNRGQASEDKGQVGSGSLFPVRRNTALPARGPLCRTLRLGLVKAPIGLFVNRCGEPAFKPLRCEGRCECHIPALDDPRQEVRWTAIQVWRGETGMKTVGRRSVGER